MPLTPYAQKLVLDYMLGGASVTRPGARWLQFATATPRTDSAFDGPFSSRLSLIFSPATSGQGTAAAAWNSISTSAGNATAACTINGWNLYDASSGGNRLAWGTLNSSMGVASSADRPVFSAASMLIVTLK